MIEQKFFDVHVATFAQKHFEMSSHLIFDSSTTVSERQNGVQPQANATTIDKNMM
jgi:hypothetical protein